MKLKYLMFTALLALASSAFGATPPPPGATGNGPMGHHEGRCQANPQECKDAAAKFDTWCSANADKCTALKAWAEKRREYCEANGKTCEERMQKMHEHMKDWCGKNPDDEHCKMMKSNGDKGDMGGDEMPPPPAL